MGWIVENGRTDGARLTAGARGTVVSGTGCTFWGVAKYNGIMI